MAAQTHGSTQQEAIAPSPDGALVIEDRGSSALPWEVVRSWAVWTLLTWNTSVWLGCGCECWSLLCWLWCWLCHWDHTSEGLPWNWPLLWPPSAGRGGRERAQVRQQLFQNACLLFIRQCLSSQMSLSKKDPAGRKPKEFQPQLQIGGHPQGKAHCRGCTDTAGESLTAKRTVTPQARH